MVDIFPFLASLPYLVWDIHSLKKTNVYNNSNNKNNTNNLRLLDTKKGMFELNKGIPVSVGYCLFSGRSESLDIFSTLGIFL